MTVQESSSNKQSTTLREVLINDDDENQSALSPGGTETTNTSSPGSTNTGTSHSSSRASRKLKLDDDLLKVDMLILSTYVKEDMYYGVKFLYDPKKDLAAGGQVFNHFRRICKKRLEGVKKYDNEREREWYINYLWKEATEERVQQDSLSLKRSSVYTVMQNRFFVSEAKDSKVFVVVESNFF